MLLAACGSRNSYETLRDASMIPTAGQSTVSKRVAELAAAAPAASVPQQRSAAPGTSKAAGSGNADDAGLTATGTVTTNATAAADPIAASVAKPGRATGAPPATHAVASPARCSGTRSTVVLGSVGEQSGLAGASIAGGPRAVAAWAASVNAAGGLDCHPLRYIIADDGGDPAQNQALAQQLVEQDHVIAFVHMDGPLAESGSEQYLASHGIPVVGSGGGAEFYYEHPTFFPQIATGSNFVAASVGPALDLPAQAGQRMGILTCIEAKECIQFSELSPGFARALGLNYVYNGQGSLAASDYSSQCLAAQKAGALTLSMFTDANSVFRVVRSCDAVGYHPQYILAGTEVVPAMTGVTSLDGAIITSATIPWMVRGNASVDQFNAVMTNFAPGVPLDPSATSGWVSAQLFATAVKALSDNPTSAEILDDMYTVKHDDLGGITQPLTYTAGQRTPQNPVCWWSIKLIGGKWASPDNGRRTCHDF
jgi:branched-chain amino acid transport system substrate-binding protein